MKESFNSGNISPSVFNSNVINSSAYLAKIIRAKSIRRLFFGLALCVVAIAILIFEQNYLANLISGPRQLDALTLEQELVSGKIKDINVNLPLVTDNVYSAGYTHITKTVDEYTNEVESESTDGEYFLTTIGQHILVLRGTLGQLPSGNFKGVIVPIDPNLQPKLISDFNNDPDLKDLASSILPFMLSNQSIYSLDNFWISLIGLGLLIFGIILVIKRALDIEDKKHYLYKIAGDAGYFDINQLSEDFISSKQAGLTNLGNSYKLSNKFLFKDSLLFFSIFPLSQMYWAYKKIIQKRIYFIPAEKNYALILNFRPKKTVQIAESQNKVDEHLVALASLCPQAQFGYPKK